ncbi:TonB-linked outer membrane protein, SusC/RagA family [Pseudarcicella hirudinis]|uniref:TonB-linked outer membrane protein, SusC/RagA family n=4 Tax=Pseudarcicella hirudinis TaxID=1079859 RepID=A0A1I5QV59_9BACT|nr:TonB-linked outer membrane protein, SusC/RagA family [Pseudarcicella hirudinis]
MIRAGIILFLLSRDFSIYSQIPGSAEEVKLTVRFENRPVLEVFKELEKKTGFRFTYNDAYLNEKLKVSLRAENKNIQEILSYLSKETNLAFKIIKKHIHVMAFEDLLSSGSEPDPKNFSFRIEGMITGTDTGEPVFGATVAIKGSTRGTVSNEKGAFVLDADNENAILLISSIGFVKKELKIGKKTKVQITLQPDIIPLEEVVVIGYGTQKKKDLTGAISTIDPERIIKIATNDVTKAMQGQIAGVSVHGSGEPGMNPQVIVRGIGSFNSTSPLYIIDGVQAPIGDLPVSDIESVQVLKDASAAAIYGSRAANGVIIITTKRGKSGKMKVDYSFYHGWQNIAKRLEVANREEYQMLVNEASANAEPALAKKPANDSDSPLFVNNIDTDWQKEAFKTGKIQEHTLGVSGGNETVTYNVSLNYFDHTGTIVGSGPGYTRYGLRVNTDFKHQRFKFGESLGFTGVDQNFMTFVHDGTPLGYIVGAIPTLPVYDNTTKNGFGSASQTIHGSYTANAIGFNSTLQSKTDRNRLIGNIYGEYAILEDLKFRLSLGYERTDWRDFNFQPKYDFGWFYVNNIAKMNDWRGYGYTGTIEGTLSYDKIIGKNIISAIAGYSVLQSAISRVQAHAEGFSEPYFPVLSNGTSGISVTGYEEENRLLSYFGRVNYSFNDKYLLTATIRRDASSRFSRQNRWGTFPSLALGWKMHNERFMKALPFISQFKLRASYGLLGNQEIPSYQYEAVINPYAHAVFGNQLAPGATQLEFATPDIKWESRESHNIGLDAGFLGNKITLTVEYYQNTSKDMLLRVRIPESTGVYNWKSPFVNGASVENSGWEFQAGYKNTSGGLTYGFNAYLTTLKNKVLSLGYGDQPIGDGITRTEVGGEVGALYGWVTDGLFQTQDEIDQLNRKSPIGRYQEVLTRPGDIRFKDINGRDANGKLTGKPDGKIDDDDRTFLGSAIPDVSFGISANLAFKAFDLSVMASGVSGNLIYNGLRASLEYGGGWDNYAKNSLNRWTPANTDTEVPRVVMFDPNKNNRASARWLEKGDYLRITTVQLGYSLPKKVLSKLKMSRLRVYVSGQNLLTLTGYTGFDPDFGNDGLFNRAIDQGLAPNRNFNAYAGGLPNPRSFMAGVQLGF